MARSVHQLIALAASAALAAGALAETPEPKEKKRRKPFDPTPSPELENVRKAIGALTPEQRKRFTENFRHWANLSPDEKRALRDREEIQKKYMQQEVQAVLQESGLALEGPRHQQFVQRYAEERRKIEEQLRKETQEKRKPLVRDLVEKLKAEFGSVEAALAPVAPERP